MAYGSAAIQLIEAVDAVERLALRASSNASVPGAIGIRQVLTILEDAAGDRTPFRRTLVELDRNTTPPPWDPGHLVLGMELDAELRSLGIATPKRGDPPLIAVARLAVPRALELLSFAEGTSRSTATSTGVWAARGRCSSSRRWLPSTSTTSERGVGPARCERFPAHGTCPYGTMAAVGVLAGAPSTSTAPPAAMSWRTWWERATGPGTVQQRAARGRRRRTRAPSLTDDIWTTRTQLTFGVSPRRVATDERHRESSNRVRVRAVSLHCGCNLDATMGEFGSFDVPLLRDVKPSGRASHAHDHPHSRRDPASLRRRRLLRPRPAVGSYPRRASGRGHVEELAGSADRATSGETVSDRLPAPFGRGGITQPLLPMRPGQVERRSHDYVRHGTTTLFAALDVATGEVTGRCYARHRHEEFLRFLQRLAGVYPTQQLHLVVDNYRTQSTRWSVRGWQTTHASTSISRPSEAAG